MQRHALLVAVLLLLLGTSRDVAADRQAEKVTPERIARLIEQLGDDEFAKREAASKALEAIGAPALAALRKADSHMDFEVRRRAARLVKTITLKGEKQIAALIQ